MSKWGYRVQTTIPAKNLHRPPHYARNSGDKFVRLHRFGQMELETGTQRGARDWSS